MKGTKLSEREVEKIGDRDEDTTVDYTTLALGLVFVAMALVLGVTATPIAGVALLIPAAALLGPHISRYMNSRNKLSGSKDREAELLSAIRNNENSITPAEAALETSLTVREADSMLSQLASQGHLTVGASDGTLYYTLPDHRRELG